MTWPASPDVALSTLRDQLVAAATTAGLSIANGNVHFPTFDPSSRGTPDTIPAFHITTFKRRKVPFAAGAAGLSQWDAEVNLLVPVTTSIAAAESSADAVLEALSAQQTGHVWRSLERGDATEPTAAAQAAAAGGAAIPTYRAVPMTLGMGLEP